MKIFFIPPGVTPPPDTVPLNKSRARQVSRVEKSPDHVEPGDIATLQAFSEDTAFIRYVDTLIERLRDAAQWEPLQRAETTDALTALRAALYKCDERTFRMISIEMGDTWLDLYGVLGAVERLLGNEEGKRGRPVKMVNQEVLIAVDELREFGVTDKRDLMRLFEFCFRKVGLKVEAVRHALKSPLEKLGEEITRK